MNMIRGMRCGVRLFVVLLFSTALVAAAQSLNGPDKNSGRLKFEKSVTRDDLQSVNSVELSADGRFLYATPWQIGALVVFERDGNNGTLRHLQTLQDDVLYGDTGLAFSPSGKYAIAACFIAKSAVLLNCDPKSGNLKILHSVRHGERHNEENIKLTFPIDAIFSPDSRYIYVLDGTAGGIAIFKVQNDKLVWQGFFQGEEGCLAGSRGVALSPDGKTMYVAGSGANSLAVLERSSETGLLAVKQVLWDGENGVEGLGGAFGVVCTRGGEFIYTTSGRFSGDTAVSVFRRESDGKLKLVHELIAERDELPLFEGGNRLALSPDEKNLYAVASRSGAVASFDRDPTTGRLKVLETFTDDDLNGITAGAAGVAISPDGKFVYIAAEGQQTISIYARRASGTKDNTAPENTAP